MFSHSPNAEHQNTKLGTCLQLQQIPLLLSALKKKVNKMYADHLKAGADSPAYTKYHILNNLQTALLERVAIFNAIIDEPLQEDMISLVESMYALVKSTRETRGADLSWLRNRHREFADVGISIGLYTGPLIIAALGAVPGLIGFFALLRGGNWLRMQARSAVGIDTVKTASIQLLDQWLDVLSKIEKNLKDDFSVTLPCVIDCDVRSDASDLDEVIYEADVSNAEAVILDRDVLDGYQLIQYPIVEDVAQAAKPDTEVSNYQLASPRFSS